MVVNYRIDGQKHSLACLRRYFEGAVLLINPVLETCTDTAIRERCLHNTVPRDRSTTTEQTAKEQAQPPSCVDLHNEALPRGAWRSTLMQSSKGRSRADKTPSMATQARKQHAGRLDLLWCGVGSFNVLLHLCHFCLEYTP